MTSPSLVSRVAEFLARYQPYNLLNPEALNGVARQVRIRFYPKGDFLFQAGEGPGEGLFVLHKGKVHVTAKDRDGQEKLIDICDLGDSFGVRTLLSGQPYMASARAEEDTLVYFLPATGFEALLSSEPEVARFFAAGLAAGMPIVHADPQAREKAGRDWLATRRQLHPPEHDLEVPVPVKDVLSCDPGKTLVQAARAMKEARTGSILITDPQKRPLGILTETDFTRKVVALEMDPKRPVSELMSSPVRCIPAGMNLSEVILEMMKHNIRHLVLTEDGTDQTPVTGVISERDVLTRQGNNPAVLAKQLLKAREGSELKVLRDRAQQLIYEYLQQDVSIHFISEMATRINDALIRRSVELSLEAMKTEGKGEPPVPFCWLSLGSEGREEQLLRTDQDNGLLYQDPEEGSKEKVAAFFLDLGKSVCELLMQAGFETCPADIMASNPEWNQPLSGWTERFRKWILTPEPKALMYANIFFDFRPGYGEEQLAEKLSQNIFSLIQDSGRFINFFAKNATENPPPLSFLRNLIVERSGEQKDKFDIKARAMMPLADAARVLAYDAGISGVTHTMDRFELLADREPQNKDLFEEAAMAYGILMRFRAFQGMEHHDTGRYIDPGELNSLERQILRNTFRAVGSIQDLLTARYRLNLLFR